MVKAVNMKEFKYFTILDTNMVKSIKISVKGKRLFINVEVCRSPLSQARGLMFSKRRNLLFVFPDERFVPLHMLFVFFPLEVFFLNSKGRVLEKAHLKPFSFFSPKKRAKYVLEVCESSFGEKVKVGDLLLWAE
jgi:uncharacterized membrane protein (UPF0127 family)